MRCAQHRPKGEARGDAVKKPFLCAIAVRRNRYHFRKKDIAVRTKSPNMLQGPLLGSIIAYTIPIILTSMLQLLFNAADLMVVGRFCGSVSVAAVGVTGSLTNLMVNFFVGLSVGAGVTVAHGLGGRMEEAVHRAVHTALPVSLVCGSVLTVVGVGFSKTFLTMMGTPAEVLPLSATYMRIYFAGITFTMVYNFCAAILRAAGDTKSPLLFLTLAGITNVVLNLFFVIVLHMNVAGVALATILSQAMAAVLVVLALMRRRDACRLELSKMRFYPIPIRQMLRIGLPAGIQSALFSISNVIIQSSINSFGSTVVSGSAASSNIENFIYAAMNAFHQTAVNFTGQNLGAHQFGRIRKILYVTLTCAAVTGIVLSAAAIAAGRTLLGLYITDSAEALEYGLIRLRWVASLYCLCGMMDVSTGALRGMGESVIPMVISVLGICVLRIGWILTFFQIPAYHTPESLYVSYPISWIITFACQFVAFQLVFRRVSQKDICSS